MKLETERLILRAWEDSDAERLWEIARDPAVGPPAGWAPHKDREHSLGVIREILSIPVTFAICLKEEGGIPIGSIGLALGGASRLNHSEKDAELGFWMGKAYWRKGCMKEAIREVLRFGFEELELENIYCGHHVRNERSKRIQSEMGFRFHHLELDSYYRELDEYRDERISLLTKEEWLAMQEKPSRRKDPLIETERILMREAAEKDIPEILDIESGRINRDFVWMGTEEEHRAEIADPDYIILLMKNKEETETLGYALIHLDTWSLRFELRRLVITKKGEGYGKEALSAILRYAFEETDTNRFWLDVYPDNEAGIRLYESLGMHRDGVIRQNYRTDRGILDQIIYSVLREEWEKRS